MDTKQDLAVGFFDSGFNIIIRDMQASDWSRISNIYQQGLDTNIATFECCCPDYENWDASHIRESRIVAVIDEKVVGWAALTPVSNRCVYAGVAEVSVYIDNDYKNRGIGFKLLERLCSLAEDNGIWTLQSGIMQDNVPSIRLHKKVGFRMVGYREKIGKDKFGKWRNTVLMEKRSAKIS